MLIQFESPYQAEVEVVGHALTFERGVPKEVPDAVGLELLENPHFVRADQPAPELHIQPAESAADPVNYVDPAGHIQ